MPGGRVGRVRLADGAQVLRLHVCRHRSRAGPRRLHNLLPGEARRMFKLLMKFDYNFSWPAFQVRAAVPHDVQRRVVHGDDVQPAVQREAAHRNRLPRLGIDGNLD